MDASDGSGMHAEDAEDPVECHRVKGHLPLLDIERFPEEGTPAAETPEAAFVIDWPDAELTSVRPYSESDPHAPVWIVAEGETFIVRRHPEGGWFASPATFLGCKSFEELGLDADERPER